MTAPPLVVDMRDRPSLRRRTLLVASAALLPWSSPGAKPDREADVVPKHLAAIGRPA
ncbi:MAG: hypothetical protein K8R60_03165 [Burkholderiales bacterium]|nr:hypothetical protein [Burkholderiales bacterium]